MQMRLLRSRGVDPCSQTLRKAGQCLGGNPGGATSRLVLSCPASLCPVGGGGVPTCPAADGGWPGRSAEEAFAAILAEMPACPAPEAGLAVGCPSLQSTIWHQVHCLFLIKVTVDRVKAFP